MVEMISSGVNSLYFVMIVIMENGMMKTLPDKETLLAGPAPVLTPKIL